MAASHDGFLRAIAAAPEDDATRLIYADWLDEHGEPERAEFIRLQCEDARRGTFDEARNALRRRIQDLFAAHGLRWLAADWPEADPSQTIGGLAFDRGFFCRVSMADRGLGPVALAEIARTRPQLALVRWWNLSGNPVESAGLQALAACPWLGRLEWLDLRRCTCGDDGWEALAASPHLSALAKVIVTCNREETYLGADFQTVESQVVFDAAAAATIRAIFRRHGRGGGGGVCVMAPLLPGRQPPGY
jgi:uncharacterized protein (TIGR02996 family)